MDAAEISAQSTYSPWWWAVVVLCLIGVGLLIRWAARATRRREGNGSSTLERLRSEALNAIDAAAAVRDVAEMLLQVRRFTGIASGSDADYLTLPELRRAAVKDPRLDDVVALVEEFTPGLFDGRTRLDVETAQRRCAEVVTAWR